MPNWCTNYVSISHEDPEMVTKAVEALNEGKLFEAFMPPPGGEWEYGWCSENWGTKWDATKIDSYRSDEKSASMIFETAWSPPIGVYETLEELGFSIDATYHEPGMSFAGHYYDGDDYCYEYDFEDEDWRDSIDDDEVADMLQEEYDIYLEMKEEEEE